MSRARHLWLLLILGALFSGPALAQKVIHFENGTSLPIRDYVIRDSMIYVDLGAEGYIAFPVEMVDHVEQVGVVVPLVPANVTSGVIRREPDPTRDYPVTGVITSYSIHYTKLYESIRGRSARAPGGHLEPVSL